MVPEIRVVERPAPIVTLDDARNHLAELPVEDEVYVQGLILAATTWIDGPTGWLGRALGIQTLELAAEDFFSLPCGKIPLPFAPVLDVVSIRYKAGGSLQTLPTLDYEADSGGVFPASGTWPFVSGRGSRVFIRFKVGCARSLGDPPELEADVPEPIRFAILLLVAHWYANREAVIVGQSVQNLPFAVEALLQPYRIYR